MTKRKRAPAEQVHELTSVRKQIYGTFVKWSDALFELADALLDASGTVGSVPSLSLEPVFRRSHGSLYKALSLGEIDEGALRIALVAGWSYQWIAQLSFDHDSWTAPLDALRIAPSADATEATIAQIRRLVELLDEGRAVPLFVFDAGYDPAALAHGFGDDPVQILVRIREDRVFYDDPPARPDRPKGTGGRPPRHGRRMKCSDPK